jgi:hypothetical protein
MYVHTSHTKHTHRKWSAQCSAAVPMACEYTHYVYPNTAWAVYDLPDMHFHSMVLQHALLCMVPAVRYADNMLCWRLLACRPREGCSQMLCICKPRTRNGCGCLWLLQPKFRQVVQLHKGLQGVSSDPPRACTCVGPDKTSNMAGVICLMRQIAA